MTQAAYDLLHQAKSAVDCVKQQLRTKFAEQ